MSTVNHAAAFPYSHSRLVFASASDDGSIILWGRQQPTENAGKHVAEASGMVQERDGRNSNDDGTRWSGRFLTHSEV